MISTGARIPDVEAGGRLQHEAAGDSGDRGHAGARSGLDRRGSFHDDSAVHVDEPFSWCLDLPVRGQPHRARLDGRYEHSRAQLLGRSSREWCRIYIAPPDHDIVVDGQGVERRITALPSVDRVVSHDVGRHVDRQETTGLVEHEHVRSARGRRHDAHPVGLWSFRRARRTQPPRRSPSGAPHLRRRDASGGRRRTRRLISCGPKPGSTSPTASLRSSSRSVIDRLLTRVDQPGRPEIGERLEGVRLHRSLATAEHASPSRQRRARGRTAPRSPRAVASGACALPRAPQSHPWHRAVTASLP